LKKSESSFDVDAEELDCDLSRELGPLTFDSSSQLPFLDEVKDDLREGGGGFTDDPARDISGSEDAATAALSFEGLQRDSFTALGTAKDEADGFKLLITAE